MAKCPKCAVRKGKRFCPALNTEICPKCCGEHRLKSIPCPRDCPYLDAVVYQSQRRKDRAASHGKQFLASMHDRFPDRESLYFATQVQAEIYHHCRQFGALDDATIHKALRDLKGLLSKIYVPEGSPHPLALTLVQNFERSPRYNAAGIPFSHRNQLQLIEELIRYVSTLQAGASSGPTFKYQEEAFDFYDQVNLEEDFHFAPADFAPFAATNEPVEEGPFRRTAGGLILPT